MSNKEFEKSLLTRTITALIMAAVILSAILIDSITYGIIFALISTLALKEYYTLINTRTEVHISSWINAIMGGYLFIASFLYMQHSVNEMIFAPYVLFILIMFISELFDDTKEPILVWAYTILGHVYVILPFSMLNALAFVVGQDGVPTYNPLLIIAAFFLISSNDSGAYLVGSQLGKHRLFERVSPKKSWEGFFGGLIFSIIFSVIFYILFPEMYPVWVWLGMAFITTVFATWGDLCESLMKRKLGVKDSGNILPGHGGWLDRFDAALFVVPALVIFIKICNYFI